MRERDRAGARRVLLRHQDRAGCSTTCRGPARGPSAASSPSAPSTRGSCGSSPAAASTSPTPSNASRTLCFDLARWRGMTRCWRCSAMPRAVLPDGGRPSAGVDRRDERPRAGCRPASRSPGSPAISRPRSSGRRASSPAGPRTPTAPAASSCSTPATRRWPPAHGLLTTVAWRIGGRARLRARGQRVHRRRRGAVAARRPRHHRAAPPRREALAESVPDTGGVYFVPAFVGPRRAVLGSLRARHDRRDSRAAPRARTWRAPRSRPSPTRAATCSTRWRPTPRSRCPRSGSTAAPPPTTSSASSRPTCSTRAVLRPARDRDDGAGRRLPGRPGRGFWTLARRSGLPLVARAHVHSAHGSGDAGRPYEGWRRAVERSARLAEKGERMKSADWVWPW